MLIFVEFLFETAAIAGREFYAGEQYGGKSEIGLVLNRDRIFSSDIKGAAGGRRILERNGSQEQ